MFLAGATWQQRADTLELDFSNGFSGVRIVLHPAAADSLSGLVWFDYDVIDQRPPATPVSAVRIPCSVARLQSPPYTREDSEERWRAQQLELLLNAENARVRRIVSPLAGTYALTVWVPGMDTVRLFGRSEATPFETVWTFANAWNTPPDSPAEPIKAEGYQLRLAIAASTSTLPRRGSSSDRPGIANAGFRVRETPILSTPDSTVWAGDNDVLFAASRLTGSGPVHDALLGAARPVNEVWFNQAAGHTVGRFVLGRDGSATLFLQVFRAESLVVTVHGERISRVVAASP